MRKRLAVIRLCAVSCVVIRTPKNIEDKKNTTQINIQLLDSAIYVHFDVQQKKSVQPDFTKHTQINTFFSYKMYFEEESTAKYCRGSRFFMIHE